MNSVIELHDSRIIEAAPLSGSIVVRFSHAYIHRSIGRPGFDRGSCWIQSIDLVVSNATLESTFTEFPQELDGGSLSVGSEVCENCFPIPFDTQGVIRFSAVSLIGELLVIVGTHVKIIEVGDARYVDEFPMK